MRHTNSLPARRSLRWLPTVACALAISSWVAPSAAQEAEWIWTPGHKKESVPRTACHFRKSFNVRSPESGQITVAADDVYELYLNGRRVGNGGSAEKLDRYDISRFLRRGRNLVAVKVENTKGPTAALVARVQVKERGGDWVNHSSNKTWKVNLNPLPLWNLPIYNDSGWSVAQSFGRLGSTPPWDGSRTGTQNGGQPQQPSQQQFSRFKISREFNVQQVVDHEQCDSLIAMTFNEFGQIIASREGGPLLLMTDSNQDATPDKVSIYCEEVKNCQGILALNGEVFVTGDGPDGTALYRLSDENRDGKIDGVRSILQFRGEMGEHGAHGVVLGPDGMLYVIVGNHTAPKKPYDENSPHQNYYEGDLFPRYEDPGGHAVGVKVPGGVILRTDLDGEKIELVAGGIRNAYDLVFNQHGDLFTHDSDMESDEGTSWYRPTRVYHVIAGGEYGWRSGWAKWPDYYVDSLPGIADTGRGSPTGAVIYNHFMLPARYHGALFLGDWSEGRILAVTTKRQGGTYTTASEVFLQGQPLNVTDLDVGPDGALYFITGGRGTSGGLFRITWRGKVPERVTNLGKGMSAVIRQPQLHSAYARQKIAGLKIQLGDRWQKDITGVVTTQANPPRYRLRGLDVMQLFGPLPTEDLLIKLSQDNSELVRAKAAQLMGVNPGEQTHDALLALLADDDDAVRRNSLEALVRSGQIAPLDKLVNSLQSDDRFEAWAARRLLERLPLDQWYQTVLTTDDPRLFVQGATALLVAHPDKRHALEVISRLSTLMGGFVSDGDFIDMLRVAQVALHRGQLQPDEVATFRERIAEEFPSTSSTMNRELARLLGYLQIASIADRYIAYLSSDEISDVDKLHLAFHLRFVQSGWTTDQRLELLRFFAKAEKWEGGGSFAHYVMNVSRDFAKGLDQADILLVLANGAQWPNAALGALYKLPQQLDSELLRYIQAMDRQLEGREDDAAKRLQVGLVAVLARSGDAQSLDYLREIWRRDPERRETVAMGLAQHPEGENWDYLVQSLPVLDDAPAREVLVQLTSVNFRPEESHYYRHVILKGLALKNDGADLAISLLEHWTGQQLSQSDQSWQEAMKTWQQWYAKEFPDSPPAELPVASSESKWDYEELLEYLSGEDGAAGSPQRGSAVFAKAQCAKCHRYGSRGESMGPDLTTVSKRFTRKEILQSILFPSHIIPDQYASKTVLTTSGKQLTGIVAPGANGEMVVLGKDGKKIVVPKVEIDEVVPNRTSAMPEGLLNELTQQEIADLFAYMGVAPRMEVARENDSETK